MDVLLHIEVWASIMDDTEAFLYYYTPMEDETFLLDKIDYQESIEEILAIELNNLQEFTDKEYFANMTEDYQLEGRVFYNPSNIIFTDIKDYEYCKYYCKKDDLVGSIILNNYNVELYIIQHTHCNILRNAINYQSEQHPLVDS